MKFNKLIPSNIKMKPLMIAMAVLAGLSFFAFSQSTSAHTGQVAADQCHNDRAVGNRHYHEPGTKIVVGVCDENGPIKKTTHKNIMAGIDKIIDLMAVPECPDLKTRYFKESNNQSGTWKTEALAARNLMLCLFPPGPA